MRLCDLKVRLNFSEIEQDLGFWTQKCTIYHCFTFFGHFTKTNVDFWPILFSENRNIWHFLTFLLNLYISTQHMTTDRSTDCSTVITMTSWEGLKTDHYLWNCTRSFNLKEKEEKSLILKSLKDKCNQTVNKTSSVLYILLLYLITLTTKFRWERKKSSQVGHILVSRETPFMLKL